MANPMAIVSDENLHEIARTMAIGNLRRAGIYARDQFEDAVSEAWLTMLEVADGARFDPGSGSAAGYLARAAYFGVKRHIVRQRALVCVSESVATEQKIVAERTGFDTRTDPRCTTRDQLDGAIWDKQVRDAIVAEFGDAPSETVCACMEVLMGSKTAEVAALHNVDTQVVYRMTARMRLRIRRSKRLAQLAADVVPDLS